MPCGMWPAVILIGKVCGGGWLCSPHGDGVMTNKILIVFSQVEIISLQNHDNNIRGHSFFQSGAFEFT